MSVIRDLRQEIIDYATEFCKTEIIDVSFPGVLEKGEEFKFKIRVRNHNCLDMKNVVVEAIGSTYASVHKHLPWPPAIIPAFSYSFNLDAFQTHTSEEFHGKALTTTNGEDKVIVTARINKWDASLDHILRDHSGAGAAEGSIEVEVH